MKDFLQQTVPAVVQKSSAPSGTYADGAPPLHEAVIPASAHIGAGGFAQTSAPVSKQLSPEPISNLAPTQPQAAKVLLSPLTLAPANHVGSGVNSPAKAPPQTTVSTEANAANVSPDFAVTCTAEGVGSTEVDVTDKSPNQAVTCMAEATSSSSDAQQLLSQILHAVPADAVRQTLVVRAGSANCCSSGTPCIPFEATQQFLAELHSLELFQAVQQQLKDKPAFTGFNAECVAPNSAATPVPLGESFEAYMHSQSVVMQAEGLTSEKPAHMGGDNSVWASAVPQPEHLRADHAQTDQLRGLPTQELCVSDTGNFDVPEACIAGNAAAATTQQQHPGLEPSAAYQGVTTHRQPGHAGSHGAVDTAMHGTPDELCDTYNTAATQHAVSPTNLTAQDAQSVRSSALSCIPTAVKAAKQDTACKPDPSLFNSVQQQQANSEQQACSQSSHGEGHLIKPEPYPSAEALCMLLLLVEPNVWQGTQNEQVWFLSPMTPFSRHFGIEYAPRLNLCNQ